MIFEQYRVVFRILLCLCWIWAGALPVFGQTALIDSLVKITKSNQHDTIIIRAYLRLSGLYNDNLNYIKARQSAEQALRMSEAIKYKAGIARAYYFLGTSEFVGNGDFVKGYDYGLRSLTVARESKNYAAEASACYLLARISSSRNNHEMAVNYLKKAIDIHEKVTRDEVAAASGYNMLAIVYKKQKKLDQALENYQKAYKIYENKPGYEYSINTIINNIAGIYFEKKEYTKALQNYEQVLDYSQKSDSKRLVAVATLNIGECYTELRDFSKAAVYLHDALDFVNKNVYPEMKIENYEFLFKMHEYAGNSDSALFYYKKYAEYKDSIFTADMQERISRMDKQLNIKEYEQQVKELKLKNQLKELELLSQIERAKALELDSISRSNQLAFISEQNQRQRLEEEKRKIEEAKLQKENMLLKQEQKLRANSYIIGLTGVVLALVTAAFAFVLLRTSRRRKADLALLKAQNMEIQRKSEEIVQQKKQIEAINDELKVQSELIGQSLLAAKTIQNAMLPYESRILEFFDDFFEIYKPRDVVSGDFYWMARVDGKAIVAAADCTGHGVPGAFMAMIGHAILDKIILLQENYDPAAILRELHNELRFAFRNQTSGEVNGMDISVVLVELFDEDMYRVVFAGAKSDFLYVSTNMDSVVRVRGNNATLGSSRGIKERFKNNVFFLNKGSIIYLCSDGYSDQTNPENKRFGRTELVRLLSSVHKLPFREQKIRIENALAEFQQSAPQRDDILVLGFKL